MNSASSFVWFFDGICASLLLWVSFFTKLRLYHIDPPQGGAQKSSKSGFVYPILLWIENLPHIWWILLQVLFDFLMGFAQVLVRLCLQTWWNLVVLSEMLLSLLMELRSWCWPISAIGRRLILTPVEHCILHCHELDLLKSLGNSNGFCAAPAAPSFSFLYMTSANSALVARDLVSPSCSCDIREFEICASACETLPSDVVEVCVMSWFL